MVDESIILKCGHPLSANALDALLDVLIDSSHAAKGSTSQRPRAAKAVRPSDACLAIARLVPLRRIGGPARLEPSTGDK